MSFRVRPSELETLPCCCGCAGPAERTWRRHHAPVGWNMLLVSLGGPTISHRLDLPICGACHRRVRRSALIPWSLPILLATFGTAVALLPIPDRAAGFVIIAFMIVFLLLVPTAAAVMEWQFPIRIVQVRSNHEMSVEFADAAVAAIFRRRKSTAGES